MGSTIQEALPDDMVVAGGRSRKYVWLEFEGTDEEPEFDMGKL